MRRIISVVLMLIIIFSVTMPVQATKIDSQTENYILSENLLQYVNTDNDNLLLRNKNYGYMNFVSGIESNELALYLIEMANIFAETGVQPDKEKYMEVLINIMATYEMDNATAIAEQQKRDNLKTVKDYAIDIAEIAANSVSLSADGDLEEWVSIAISGVNNLIGNTDDWIEAFSNLETIVQDYSQYNNFLMIIEENASGDLKDAAFTLRTSMEKAMEIKLNTYNDISNDNFENYTEYFFEDVFFESLRLTNDYSTDAEFRFFVDCGDEVMFAFTDLKTSWELGKGIGILIGNIAVGGEDLANRMLEMQALSDISMILQKEIFDISTEFLNKYPSMQSNGLVEDYVAYSNLLVGCRIRGEYCLYSVVASDAGLLSWASKKDAQEAKEWYERQSKNILDIRSQLAGIYEQNSDASTEDNKALLTESIIKEFGIYPIGKRSAEIHKVHEFFDIGDWDDRSGIISAKVTDMNKDGVEELLLIIAEDVNSVDYEISISGTSSNIYAYIYEIEEGEPLFRDSIRLIQGVGGICSIGLLNTEDVSYVYIEEETEYNGDIICNWKLISYDNERLLMEIATEPMQMEWGYCINISAEGLNKCGKNINENTLWWFGNNGNLEYSGTDEQFIGKTPIEAMHQIVEWYGVYSTNIEDKLSSSEYYEELCLLEHQLLYYSDTTEKYVNDVIDYSGLKRTQSTIQDYIFDETVMIEKSVGKVKEIYNTNKEGVIVVFEDEITYMGGDEYFITLRYQMSDKEIKESIGYGGTALANIWYADICLRLSSGEYSDNNWMTQKNLWHVD